MYRYINSVHRISVVALSAVALYLCHVIHTHAIFDIANLGFSKYSVVYSFSFIGTDHVMLAVLSHSLFNWLTRRSKKQLKIFVDAEGSSRFLKIDFENQLYVAFGFAQKIQCVYWWQTLCNQANWVSENKCFHIKLKLKTQHVALACQLLRLFRRNFVSLCGIIFWAQLWKNTKCYTFIPTDSIGR